MSREPSSLCSRGNTVRCCPVVFTQNGPRLPRLLDGPRRLLRRDPMMRKILALLTVAVSLLFLGVVSAGTAAALGGESLGCVVNPNPNPLTFSDPCGDSAPPDGSR